jgi:hypothetical protein
MGKNEPVEGQNEWSGVQLNDDGELGERPLMKPGKRKWQSKPKYVLDRPLRRYALTTAILIFGLAAGLGIGLASSIPHTPTVGATPAPAQTATLPLQVAVAQTAQPPQQPQPGPQFVYPVNDQTLDYEGAYLFKVSPIANAQGYLFGFFQKDENQMYRMVWENWRDDHTLSNTEYGIQMTTPAHDAFVVGDVQVSVRAQVAGQWTNATIITIHLQPRCKNNPTLKCTMTPTPGHAAQQANIVNPSG